MVEKTEMRRAMRRILFSLTIGAVAISGLAWCAARNPAAAADVSFADKTVNMTIGFAAGGAVDLYGRTVGKYIPRFLPGRPNLVVLNQPGAGGVIALNEWSRRADTNGLSVTTAAQSQTDPAALRETHARYDPASFKILGGLGAASQGLYIRTDARPRLTDKKAEPVVAGIVGATLRGGTYQVLWGQLFLGWNVRWVRGYPSTAELRQAVERGEVDMATFGSSKDFTVLNNAGKYTIVSQTGRLEDGKRIPRPILGDAPIFSDLVRGKIADPTAQKAFAYWEDVSQIGFWVALPPATPDAIVDTYVKAFEAMTKDAAFQDEYGRIDPDGVAATKRDYDRIVQNLAKVSSEPLDYLDAELRRQGFTTGN
jgi:tripartite-type tricarboxylate transporter receptor subunit TctC